ncbi:MAG: DUF4430 domain-containing protein [Candidatus Thorarchaeota archaeon]
MSRLRILLLLAITFTIVPVHAESWRVENSDNFKPSANGISLHIDYGNGTTDTYDGVAGSNALEATESVAVVLADWTGNLAFVYSINGVSSKEETGRWWQYWVNGDYASVAANLYVVQDNDLIIWKFIDSQVEPPTTTEPNGTGQLGPLAIASTGLGSLGIGFLVALYLMRKRN